MKEAEASMLIKTGVIERAVLYRTAGGSTGWELHLYGQELHPSIGNAVELARGGRRSWSSLDTAHEWVRRVSEGRKIAIEIDG